MSTRKYAHTTLSILTTHNLEEVVHTCLLLFLFHSEQKKQGFRGIASFTPRMHSATGRAGRQQGGLFWWGARWTVGGMSLSAYDHKWLQDLMHFDLRDLMFSDLRSDLIAVDLISEMGL